MTNFLLAGGGTAGHVNPLIALADQIMAANHKDQVWALGTVEGLESRLIPAEGYELLTIERLPFPRRPNFYAIKFPMKFSRAVSRVQKFIKTHQIDVVVGFGGYASAPAYVAAKRSGIPFVVHEANALPGWANKFGAKNAAAVGVAFANTPLPKAVHVGMPLRAEIEFLNKEKDVRAARENFGLDPDIVTLLVTGGSLGAKKINETIEASRAVLSAAGIQVLHIVGGKSELSPVQSRDYVRIGYCDEMASAIAASSFAISRAGASTVSEFAAVGLPAAYIPYPVGNGEQRYNVAELVKAGGGLVVEDAHFTPEFVSQEIVPLISSPKLLKEMSVAAKAHGISDGAKRLLKLVKGVL
jgi:UDP-N-acetylglucosamine--N-acetylmuramyl-(pentapeptide) pyrophosphoryl-undecaprenol N-acetylglucosamine transferase